jgi:patatin-like phospholipase/acyl hydrolase
VKPFSYTPRSGYYNKVELDPNEKVKHKQISELRRPYRILCLDGGGARGALTTVLLTRIVRHRPTFLDEVDFICGTSAGGILALMLASGYEPEECHNLYTWAIPHIFGHNPWRLINPFRSKYSDKAKQELMQYYFGERTMADLKKSCAAVAFRLDGRKSRTHSFFHREGWRPAVFSNIPKGSGVVDPDLDLKVWDAAMRTSAAPTYFPVFRGYTDGGIVANNPSIIAVSRAMSHYPHVTPKNIALLSVGTCSFAGHDHREKCHLY